MVEVILRGRVLSFERAPLHAEDTSAFNYFEDGAVHIRDGLVISKAAYEDVIKTTSKGIEVIDHRPHLIMPGFIDTHAHYPQMQVIASYGTQLIEWLNKYTFPEEMRFKDSAHAERVAAAFLDTSLMHGTTTVAAYSTVHKQATSAFFEAALARNMRVLSGKTMMDRNAPMGLCDTPETAYDDSKDLIQNYHDKGRISYVISPRFAITSTQEQLEITRQLMLENPTCYLQTHVSENRDEIDFACSLYPDAKDYLDIYAQYDLLHDKSLMGHSIHLGEREIDVMAETEAVAVFCPTSNLFLGSGLFHWKELAAKNVRIATATDTGGGTNFSMLRTMDEAYKVQQLNGFSLSPLMSFYQISLGNAEALSLDDKIGKIEKGYEADLVVLNANARPEMALRYERLETLAEELFLLQTLGDDRCIEETYVAGKAMKASASRVL